MSSGEPVVWVLNLDAEDELARRGAHTPTAAITTRVEALVATTLRGAGGLIGPEDEVLWPGTGPVTPGREGRAWCPTRWALSAMQRAGLRLPTTPGDEVLRRVNHRTFSHQLGQALPAAGYAETSAELADLLAQTQALARASVERWWLLKRPLGYAGRGRRRVRAGKLSAADEAWVSASLRLFDGLQVEPWVARELDCALHGWVDAAGCSTLGAPTVQRVDEWGAWQGSTLASDGALTTLEVEQLTNAAHQTAEALHEAGYWGPFGLDGFRWRSPDGQLHFQPRCEVNARYSMGWGLGMAGAPR